jgi:DNA-binding transcriptional LysR family regulator
VALTEARLHTFLAVVETGTARAAATQLSVTESAVSAALATLQRDLGVRLFERDGRRLRLTHAGTVFTGYARRILGLIDEATDAARAGAEPERGHLRLAAVTTAGEYLLPGLLAGFRHRFPAVTLSLQIGPRATVLGLLRDHAVDVVIGGRAPAEPGVRSWATRPNALVVVGSPGPTPDLTTATWLLREPGSGTRDATSALLESWQADPPSLTLGSPGAVIASVERGLGLTVVSADAVEHLVSAGRLVVIPAPGTPLERPWHAIAAIAPTATARLFLEHICDPVQAGPTLFRPSVRPSVQPSVRRAAR